MYKFLVRRWQPAGLLGHISGQKPNTSLVLGEEEHCEISTTATLRIQESKKLL